MIPEIVGTLFGVLVVAVVAGAIAIRNLIYISGPNEVLIFSGRRISGGTDGEVGYRLIKGGRGIRIPLLEKVDRIDLTNMNIEVHVRGAYSKGGIPLNVQAVANVKIAGEEPTIHNAIERLLPKNRGDVMRIAKETLEGNLRGVLATLTPEQVNEDKEAFARSLLSEAEEDLSKIGLVLDNLKIQNVTDDQGYLQAIGRKQSAELQRRARIAEAAAKAEALVQAASNDEQTRLRQIAAQVEIVTAEAERRIIDADTRRAAVVAEEEADVSALIVKAGAELDVQRARIDQVERKLQAELIAPWVARRDAMVYEAEGKSAKVIEEGNARASALADIVRTWQELGDDAKRLMLLQKLDSIVDIMAGTIPELKIDNFTMIEPGAATAAEHGTMPVRAISTIEQVKRATGVDLGELAKAAVVKES